MNTTYGHSALLMVLFLLAVVSTVTAQYSGGSGTAQDPYQIATAADLIALGETPEDYDKHFLLTADIDLDPNLPGGRVFDKAVIAPDTGPAHDFQGYPFTGVFDGNGHTISRLTITGGGYLGLFGKLSSSGATASGEVKNLGLTDVEITGSDSPVGGLVGSNGGPTEAYSSRHLPGHVANSYSTGMVSGTWRVGGLVGSNYFDSSIIASYSTAMVSGDRAVGGLVGYNLLDSSIIASHSSGSVSGSSFVGGLAGGNDGRIATSHSSGSVSGAGEYIGGLVGSNSFGSIAQSYSSSSVSGPNEVGGLAGHNSYDGSIDSSYSSGSVRGTGHSVGGLVGSNGWAGKAAFGPAAWPAYISNSYSTGAVSGASNVGGLVGFHRAGSIAKSYSSGSVSGNSDVGGLVGQRSSFAGISSGSVWDTQTSGQSESGDGAGLTTAEMMDPIAF